MAFLSRDLIRESDDQQQSALAAALARRAEQSRMETEATPPPPEAPAVDFGGLVKSLSASWGDAGVAEPAARRPSRQASSGGGGFDLGAHLSALLGTWADPNDAGAAPAASSLSAPWGRPQPRPQASTPSAMPTGGGASAAFAPPGRPASMASTEAPAGGEIDNSSREAFVRTAWPHMLRAAEGDTNLAELMLAKAISENGSIGSGQPIWANNFSGIKGEGDAGSVEADTWEDYGNGPVNIRDKFAAYSSPQAGMAAFLQFLRNNSRYAPALARYQQTRDASQLFRDIREAGYATDPAWADKVENIRANQIAPIVRGSTMQKAAPEDMPAEDGMSAGDQKRAKLAQMQAADQNPPTLPGAQTAPGPVPPDRSTEAGIQMLPDMAGPGLAPPGRLNDVPPDAMYRQPLMPTDPEASTGDYSNPDDGPRESGYTVPPDPSTYGAAGDDPGAAPYSPPSYNDPTTTGTLDQPLPPQQELQEPPQPPQGALERLYDTAGNAIGWVRSQAQAAGRQIAPVQPGASYLGAVGQGVSNVAQGLTPAGQTPAEYARGMTPRRDTMVAPEAALRDIMDVGTNAPTVPGAATQAITDVADRARENFRTGAQAWTDGDIGSALFDLGMGAIDVIASPYTVAGKSIDALLPTMANGPVSMGDALTNLDMVRDIRALAMAGIKVTRPVVEALRNGTAVEDLIALAGRGMEAAGRAGRALAEGMAPAPRAAEDGGVRLLGSGVVPSSIRPALTNAAQGAAFGAASEDVSAELEGRDPDPTNRLVRGAIGAGLATVAGSRAARQAALRAGREVGSGVVPEVRIPRAGYATDISAGAERLVRDASEANAPRETVRRAEVARKAEEIIGVRPEDARRWQDEALGNAPDARAVRGEALRQAEYIDAENADRAIERLREAHRRAKEAGAVENLSADDRFDVADALLEAAEMARAFQRSAAASTAEGRATARALAQRRNAITARQAFEAAQRARQVGQDAAFAARETQRAAATGQVTEEGVRRLRIVRDKLLEAERNGLVGDGVGGRLAEREQRPAMAMATAGTSPRPGVGLGTQIASRAGASLAGGVFGASAGAALPADTPDERRRNALIGAGVGMVGGPVAQRLIGRGGRGAMGLLGSAPTPGNPTRSLAIGADPARRYEFRYRVVDLDSLTPSNLPNGAPNPSFPRELQPRSRERAASQLQIDKIAQSLDPVALLHDAGRLDSGPPIIGPDMLVESGNGRTLAMRRAAEQHPERYRAYVDALSGNLGEFGLSEADLQGVRRPALVRERVSDVDRPAFVREANGSVTQRMSPAEQAAQSAANLSDDVVTQLQIGENDSIAAALRRADNRDLVRQWMGTLPDNERAELLDAGGNISPQGYDQLAQALLTRTYGDGAATRAFIEAGNPEVRNVQNAVMGSLPDVARAEALIRAGQRDPGLSVAEDVARATEVLARLKQEGVSVGDYVRQVAMGDRELTPFQERVLQFLDQHQRRPSAIRDALRSYADAVANAADPNQVDMFGGAVASVTKEDAWTSATAGAQRERQARIAAQKARQQAENAARTPVAEIVPSTGGPAGSLAVEGAPQPAPRPGALPENVAPMGGPEGTLAQEGAPVRLAAPTAAERGTLPAGGPEGTLTLASGRSVKDVAAQIDEVLANPNAPGAVERLQQLQQLHADLQEISTTGFRRSSEIRQRLQRNGLLRAGLASKDQNVDALVTALARTDPDKPEEMRAVLNVISKPRLIDKILEYQYVNMLSSPITQLVNISSNAAQIAGRLLLQNPLEFAYSGGKSTGVGAAFQGAARGFREGMGEAGQIMRTGTSTSQVDRALELGDYSHVNREALTEQFGKAGALLHVISTRPLAAMDALLGHVAYASAAEQLAQRKADRLLKAGAADLKGMSREQARQHILANIWDHPDIIDQAGKIEEYTLLRSKDTDGKGWGRVEQRLRALASVRNPAEDAGFSGQATAFLANQILPFFNVPLNFAKQGAERTIGAPVNLVRGVRASVRGETERAADLYAKATIGAAAMTTAGVLAMGDNLTGDGPSESGQRAVWELTHRRNSYRVPGTDAWISWEGTPWAIPFGMMAGVREGWTEAQQRAAKKGQSDPVDVVGSAAMKAGQGAMQGFFSQSFIKGLADQYKFLTGQDVSLAGVAAQQASTVGRFVPASGLLNFMASIADSVERDVGRPQAVSDLPQNVGARVAQRIPGLRSQLDPKLDPYGEPVPNERQGAAGALPYYRGEGIRTSDPITQRLERSGVGAPSAPSEITFREMKIPLTMREQRMFQQEWGRAFRRELVGIQRTGKEYPAAAWEKARDEARKEAEDAVLSQLGSAEIRRRVEGRAAAGAR